MSDSRFVRLDSREPLYQSPTPAHEFDDTHESQDVSDQPTRWYRDQQPNSYQPNERQHSVSDFTREQQQQHTRQMSYESSRRGSEMEKPLYNRRDTASSHLSSKLSAVSEGTSKLLQPVFAKPWQHVKSFDMTGSSTTKTFSRARQRRRIFITGLVQWLLPASFCGLIVVVMWHYSRKRSVDKEQRYFYNSLMLGLTLCLGFSVQSGYKKFANLMRWRILASDYFDLKHFELIMESSSQMAIVRLLWPRRRQSGRHLPAKIRVICLLYLIVAFGLQVGIALVGLCVSVDTADGILDLVSGNVTIANLQYLTAETTSDANLELRQQRTAQEYGSIAGRFDHIHNPKEGSNSLSRTVFSGDDYPFYWMYFFDQCPYQDQRCEGLITTTARWMAVQSTCEEYRILSGGKGNDGTNVTYVDSRGREGWLDITRTAISTTTSYLSNQDDTCGPRCTQTLTVNYGGVLPDQIPLFPPQMFSCNTTVFQVSNGPNSTDYLMPNNVARLFAGAIGWSGVESRKDSFAENSYPNTRLSWDGNRQTADDVAQVLMEYSTGAIAALDQFGDRIVVFSNNSPRTAQTVNVKWRYAIIVLSAVPGIQLITLILVTVWAGAAVIPDGTYLSNARLLRPIIEKLGRNGCLLTGDEIADELGEMGRYRVKYGALRSEAGDYTDIQDARYHLDLIAEEREVQEVKERGWLFNDNMPQGRYD